MALDAANIPHNRLANTRDFDWIFYIDHAFGQRGKLGAAELLHGIELMDEPRHARLFFGREASNFVNDLRRSHGTKLMRNLQIRSLRAHTGRAWHLHPSISQKELACSTA